MTHFPIPFVNVYFNKHSNVRTHMRVPNKMLQSNSRVFTLCLYNISLLSRLSLLLSNNISSIRTSEGLDTL